MAASLFSLFFRIAIDDANKTMSVGGVVPIDADDVAAIGDRVRDVQAKAEADAKAKADSKSAGKPSSTARSGYTSYGESSAGAGITEPSDSEKTVSSTTLPARKQARAGQ